MRGLRNLTLSHSYAHPFGLPKFAPETRVADEDTVVVVTMMVEVV
jgi:hypothetical protein